MTAVLAQPGRAIRTRPKLTAWLYYTPALVALVVWVYGPLLFTGALSFMDWDLLSPVRDWVGLDNYRQLLSEPEFANAAQNTGLYAAAILPLATIVPAGLAIMLWKRPGRTSEIYRVLLFLPVVLAPVANALAWRFILDPLQGALNAVIGVVGIAPVNWLTSPGTALLTIVAVTAGKVIALNTLLFGAALANLDRRTVEAARLDDAREWEITRLVILPQLVRTMILLALLALVVVWPWIFTNVAVLTQGGPSGATDNVYYRLYTYGFNFFYVGEASAAAVVISVVLAIPLTIYSVIARRSRGHGR